MSSTATIESPSKTSATNLRYHTNGIDIDPSITHTNGNGVTAVVVTNPLASSSFSSTTSRYQSSVMNKYKNLATPDLTHPLSSLKQMTHVLTNNNGNNSALDPHAYFASKYRRADPYHRSATSTPSSTPTKSTTLANNEPTTTTDGPPQVAPPPPPPPPPPIQNPPSASSSTTSIKGPSTRSGLDDLHQSPILHSTTTHSHTSNGDYRSTLYPNIVNNPTSTPIPSPPHGYGSSTNHNNNNNSTTISKLIRTRQESETNSINKEQLIVPKIREISSNVGFVSLPDQVHRRAVKKGFEFNLMVVGQSGLGKSTFINTLFQTELYGQDFPSTVHRKKKTVSIDSSSIILKEKGVQLRLTIVDTPGFGDAVDNSNCWQPIIDYVDSKYEEYLNAESRVIRKPHITDNRIHCCLYFITPTGHSLQALDIEFMKRLHDRVNIIPVIAKADTLTSDELRLFKKSIMQDIINEKMKIYEFPECDDDDDENKLTKIYKDKVPFAVVGSNFILEKGTKRTRVRQYAWGVVDVEDEVHSDFIALRSMLIRTNLNDLRDVTHNIHYENYRYKKLNSFNGNETKNGKTLQTSSLNKNFFSQLEDERNETETRLEKMSRDMEGVYQSKVTEKLQKLDESKQNVLKTQETYRLNIQQEEERLQSKRDEFERMKREWEESLTKTGFADQIGSLTKTAKKGLF